MSLISFASDNHSGVAPAILQAMNDANSGYAASYEQDPWSQLLKDRIRNEFQAFDSALVFNGTAANVICLQMALESYQAALCAQTSHLNLDECGAPEKIAGVKLVPIPTLQGKIDIAKIPDGLIRNGDQHHSQVKMISITQPTEYGTVYSMDEIAELRKICDQHHLYLHMDGARLSNAAASLRVSLAELTQHVDLLSFGGAKKGLLLGEMVILRNPELNKKLKFFRKQSLQLPSKTRFLAAGFLAYMEKELWLEMAQHENQIAQYLRESLTAFPEIVFTHDTQANSVFCQMPRPWIKELRKKFFFYVWDEKTFELRLMISFCSNTHEIDAFIEEIKKIRN